jgi:hypothetical protein
MIVKPFLGAIADVIIAGNMKAVKAWEELDGGQIGQPPGTRWGEGWQRAERKPLLQFECSLALLAIRC